LLKKLKLSLERCNPSVKIIYTKLSIDLKKKTLKIYNNIKLSKHKLNSKNLVSNYNIKIREKYKI